MINRVLLLRPHPYKVTGLKRFCGLPWETANHWGGQKVDEQGRLGHSLRAFLHLSQTRGFESLLLSTYVFLRLATPYLVEVIHNLG